MKTTLSKVIVATLFGIVYIFFSHFNLLEKIPIFHCEGFGCIGVGIYYLFIGVVLIPVFITLGSVMSIRENKITHALQTFAISLIVMLLSLQITSTLHEYSINRDIKASEESEKQFYTEAERSVASEQVVEKPLSIEKVDATRNISGRGVFQAKITPDEFFTDTPTLITVSAEIGSVRDVESVVLKNISDSQTEPIDMYDTGEDGDLLAHDTIFTAQENITASTPQKITYEIEVRYTDGYKATSQTLQLQVYTPLPEGLSVDASAFAKQIENEYLAHRSTMDTDTAREKVLMETKNNPDVSYAELTGHNMSILYKGMRVWVSLYGPMDGPPIN